MSHSSRQGNLFLVSGISRSSTKAKLFLLSGKHNSTAEVLLTCGPQLAAPLPLLIDHTLQILLRPEACFRAVICLCYLLKGTFWHVGSSVHIL